MSDLVRLFLLAVPLAYHCGASWARDEYVGVGVAVVGGLGVLWTAGRAIIRKGW